jgi:hypothetical protein
MAWIGYRRGVQRGLGKFGRRCLRSMVRTRWIIAQTTRPSFFFFHLRNNCLEVAIVFYLYSWRLTCFICFQSPVDLRGQFGPNGALYDVCVESTTYTILWRDMVFCKLEVLWLIDRTPYINIFRDGNHDDTIHLTIGMSIFSGSSSLLMWQYQQTGYEIQVALIFFWRVIIKLGVPSGTIVGFDIDTTFFNGNEAPACSVYGLDRLDPVPDSPDDPQVRSRQSLCWLICSLQSPTILVKNCCSGTNFCRSFRWARPLDICSRSPRLRKDIVTWN